MLYSHEHSSTEAKYTVQLGQSNNFLYTVSYQQIKTWSLLYKDNQSKSWEKLWGKKTEIVCHWSLLMSLELAEQSIQLLTCHISRWGLRHHSPQDNQSKSWKKVWPLYVLSLITSHAVSTSRAEHTTSYMSCKQTKTFSLFTSRQPIQIFGKGVTSGVVVTGDCDYDTWEQFIAGVHKAGNIF